MEYNFKYTGVRMPAKTLVNIVNELNNTRTENGDIAKKTTFNHNLDFFYTMGASRWLEKEKLLSLFKKALGEDAEQAIKSLFYLRDIRGGMGERQSFRDCLEVLAEKLPEEIANIIEHVPEYGRWDDLWCLLDYPIVGDAVVELIEKQLAYDILSDEPSLLAKWLPSINASSPETRRLAIKLAREMRMDNKEYRKTLSDLRKKIGILETKLTNKEYDFEYSQVPSNAFMQYEEAFKRSDGERYRKFLSDLSEGKTKINSAVLYPYEIIKKVYQNISGYSWGDSYTEITEDDILLMETRWRNIQRNKTKNNTIVVRDGSGSMEGLPILVATSLAILYSEQLGGEFKDMFVTFSRNPELVDLGECKNLYEKLEKIDEYNDVSNTDIEKVYNLIFEASKGVPEEDQIDKIVIISDMEFDWGADDLDKSTYEAIKEKYRMAGMKMPEIVYWNVASRNVHFPTSDKENIKLVSGFSNHILDDILNDKTANAVDFMIECTKKYQDIAYDFTIDFAI